MRSHQQIITDGNGPTAVARVVGAEPGTAKQWRRNDRIPASYWTAFVDAGLATLDELATAAAAKREAA